MAHQWDIEMREVNQNMHQINSDEKKHHLSFTHGERPPKVGMIINKTSS